MNKIITHTLVFLISITWAPPVASQRLFGNEWIVPSQTYLRIPVVANGLYRISSTDLQKAGFPTDSNRSDAFQMFWRGNEIAIQIESDPEHKNQIIFKGQRNDGTLDSALYPSQAAFPNAHYSLYSDTSAYFLTWNFTGILGKRMNFNVEGAFDSLAYHFAENEKVFISHYATGNFYPPESGFNEGSALSGYDVGEGWTGPEIKDNAAYSLSLGINNAIADKFSEAEIELVLVGRSAGNHVYELWSASKSGMKRKVKTIAFRNFEPVTLKTFLDPADLTSESELNFVLVPTGNDGSVSLSYAKLRYPSSKPPLHEQPKPILNPRLVKFNDIDPQTFNYLIVTHPAVRIPIENTDPVTAYAAYRASVKGGGYKPLIVHSEAVYDQFNYGEPGPTAIRNMISWVSQAGNLQFVFLIGRSADPQTARKSGNARTLDMVPNAGWPGSDLALVMEMGSESTLHAIVPIGRLNASISQHVHDYLLKVKAMEAEPASAPWRKSVLHLSGGRSPDEIAVFSGYVKSFEQKIKNSTSKLHVETISKTTGNLVEKLPVYIPINKGVSLVTFFGHSSLDVTDVDIGMANGPETQIHNHPHYPAIIVNGCAAGSIFYSEKVLSNDWILSPNNGAVLFLAHTFNGLSTDLKHYTEKIYEVLADPNFTNQPFGIIQNEAVRRNMIDHKNITAVITSQQMLLHGDPAIRIFPAVLPDSTLVPNNTVTITVSPNPSEHLFQFSMEVKGLKATKEVKLSVHDIWGRKVEEISFDAHPGKNEWFWHPGNLPSGVYLYSLEIDQTLGTFSPDAQKGLQGRLIWIH